jgi:hypothetical protein
MQRTCDKIGSDRKSKVASRSLPPFAQKQRIMYGIFCFTSDGTVFDGALVLSPMGGDSIASRKAVKSGGALPKRVYRGDFLCIADSILLGFGWLRRSL